MGMTRKEMKPICDVTMLHVDRSIIALTFIPFLRSLSPCWKNSSVTSSDQVRCRWRTREGWPRSPDLRIICITSILSSSLLVSMMDSFLFHTAKMSKCDAKSVAITKSINIFRALRYVTLSMCWKILHSGCREKKRGCDETSADS